MIKVSTKVEEDEIGNLELCLMSIRIDDVLEPQGFAIHRIEDIIYAVEDASDSSILFECNAGDWVELTLQRVPRSSNGTVIIPGHFIVISHRVLY